MILCAISPTVTFAQVVTDEPEEGSVEVTGITAVPVNSGLWYYRQAQAPVISGAFCTTPSDLAVFTLQSSAITDTDAIGTSSTFGAVRWASLHVSEYDRATLASSHPHYATMQASTTTTALLIGRLEGSCGTVACLAWGFDLVDSSGVPKHYLIPLKLVNSNIEDIVDEVNGLFGPRSNSSDPCSSGTYCHDTYRQRLSDALKVFADCLKDGAPPISIWNVGCFVGCVPLLAGTPILYAACVAACNGIVSAPGLIDTNTCANALENEKANAKQSYCACLAHKLQNCSQLAETDLVGCP